MGRGRREVGSALAAAAALVVLSGVGAQAASAASVDVFVGYADSAHATPGNFPTPWFSPNNPSIVFQGVRCAPGSTSCEYDASAVRMVNNLPIAVTVNAVTVAFSSSCVYDIWPHDVSLGPGSQLIVTQLRGGTAHGCTNTTSSTDPNFGLIDGSDIGPNGVSWKDNCTQSGVVPEVDVTVNHSTTPFVDTGRVLNTGGVDSSICNANGTTHPSQSESTQWTPIGQIACPGAALSLAPASQDVAISQAAGVTATLDDSCGHPLQGATVKFGVIGTGRPNSGKTGTGVTDRNGNASFSYADTNGRTGVDDVQASVSNPAGTIFSNVVFVHWSVTGGSASGGLALITNLSLTPRAFPAAPSGPAVAAAKKRKRRFGTRVSYNDSQAATTTFTVQRAAPGRRSGASCVRPRPGNRKHKHCTRFVAVGTFTHGDVAGQNHFRFTGRVNGHKLGKGMYRLKAVPSNAAGSGPPTFTAFRIIR